MKPFLSKIVNGLKKVVVLVSIPITSMLDAVIAFLPLVFWMVFNALDKLILWTAKTLQWLIPKLIDVILRAVIVIKRLIRVINHFGLRVWNALPPSVQRALTPLGVIARPVWRTLAWVLRSLEKLLHIVMRDVQTLRRTIFQTWKAIKAKRGLDDQSIGKSKQELAEHYSAEAIHTRFNQRVEDFKETSEQQLGAFWADLQKLWQRYQDMRSGRSQHRTVAELSPLTQERNTILVASIIINVLALAFPLLMLQLYDRILPHQSADTLTIFAFGVGLAVCLESIIRVLRSYTTAWISARFEHRAYLSLTDRLLAEPLHDFERKGTGAVMEEFKSVSSLKYHYSGQTFQQLMDLPFTALYVLIVFLISPWVGLLLLTGYSIFIFITWKNGREDPALIKEQKEGDLRRANFLNEILKNVHTLKSMTREALML